LAGGYQLPAGAVSNSSFRGVGSIKPAGILPTGFGGKGVRKKQKITLFLSDSILNFTRAPEGEFLWIFCLIFTFLFIKLFNYQVEDCRCRRIKITEETGICKSFVEVRIELYLDKSALLIVWFCCRRHPSDAEDKTQGMLCFIPDIIIKN